MKNEKLAKTSVVLDRILKIIQGFMVAGAIVAAIFIPLTAIFGEKIIADASHLELGNLTIKLAGNLPDYLDIPAILKSIFVSLAVAIVICCIVWYCLRILRSILAPMKEGRPFEGGISDKIRTLGWTVLVGGAVVEIGRMISAVLELQAYDLSMITENPMVESVTYNYSISLWFVVTALILFFLSHIFRYGEVLQQESDETL